MARALNKIQEKIFLPKRTDSFRVFDEDRQINPRNIFLVVAFYFVYQHVMYVRNRSTTGLLFFFAARDLIG
jgi:hypothetical protein